jgi:hypothetical protein
MRRALALLAAFLVLAPAVAAALAGCGMAGCPTEGPSPSVGRDPHACCPGERIAAAAGCCAPELAAAGERGEGTLPAGGSELRGAPPCAVQPSPAEAAAVAPAVHLPPPEPAASPPRDLLSRHCILRI